MFDGETGCDMVRNHPESFHRFHDPSGSGRFVLKDDYGKEIPSVFASMPRGKNKACNEIGHPSTHRRNTMTDQTSTTVTDATPSDAVVKQSLWTKFNTKHPRTARVLAISGVVIGITSVAIVSNTVRKNAHHLDASTKHLSEAAAELSSAVSPDPETD